MEEKAKENDMHVDEMARQDAENRKNQDEKRPGDDVRTRFKASPSPHLAGQGGERSRLRIAPPIQVASHFNWTNAFLFLGGRSRSPRWQGDPSWPACRSCGEESDAKGMPAGWPG
jgi:hypothetical protein